MKLFLWFLWIISACAGIGFRVFAKQYQANFVNDWGWLAIFFNGYWIWEATDTKFHRSRSQQKLPKPKREDSV